MGTVVFPEADIKFFLTASTDTRALRRYKEMADATATSLEEVSKDLNRRDHRDSTRELAPLKPADDAIRIDSNDLSIQQVVDKMISYVHEK